MAEDVRLASSYPDSVPGPSVSNRSKTRRTVVLNNCDDGAAVVLQPQCRKPHYHYLHQRASTYVLHAVVRYHRLQVNAKPYS